MKKPIYYFTLIWYFNYHFHQSDDYSQVEEIIAAYLTDDIPASLEAVILHQSV